MIEQTQKDSNAIISLTLGILSILIPVIGLVLGIVGIVMSRKALKEIGYANGNGRGLAISGLICSIVGIITQLFGLLTFILYFNISTSYY